MVDSVSLTLYNVLNLDKHILLSSHKYFKKQQQKKDIKVAWVNFFSKCYLFIFFEKELGSLISAHRNLRLLGSGNSPASAS